MDASLSNDLRLVCPYCTNEKFIVVRRRIGEDETLIKTCRCQACGDQFEYAVDQEGSLVRENETSDEQVTA
jgi:DNA-directed RNA polymerase subunit M/transcription elongation factor TFIIS